jgi:predicted negative regulator of RcsB-dependent stress response
MCLLFVFALAVPALAGGQDGKVDKTATKARAKLESKADPSWKDYCKSAQMCIKKNTNLDEAQSWLEKSIEMDRNPDNLEAMGDYYLANNDKRKAADYYLESLKAGVLDNPNYQDQNLQKKLTDLQKDLT